LPFHLTTCPEPVEGFEVKEEFQFSDQFSGKVLSSSGQASKSSRGQASRNHGESQRNKCINKSAKLKVEAIA